jgi:hypothetical protein
MKTLPALLTAAALAAFAGCTTAPKDAGKDVAKEVPPLSNDAKEIRWEEECLVYPKQDALRGLQGSGIRRNCSSTEAPESINSVLTEGLAADEKTALGLARVVLTRVYGDRIVDSAQPSVLTKGDRWLVQWEVKSPETKPDALKRLSVEIVKKTGAVARMFVSVVKE